MKSHPAGCSRARVLCCMLRGPRLSLAKNAYRSALGETGVPDVLGQFAHNCPNRGAIGACCFGPMLWRDGGFGGRLAKGNSRRTASAVVGTLARPHTGWQHSGDRTTIQNQARRFWAASPTIWAAAALADRHADPECQARNASLGISRTESFTRLLWRTRRYAVRPRLWSPPRSPACAGSAWFHRKVESRGRLPGKEKHCAAGPTKSARNDVVARPEGQ